MPEDKRSALFPMNIFDEHAPAIAKMTEDLKRVYIPERENLAGKEMADAWNKELYGDPTWPEIKDITPPRPLRRTGMPERPLSARDQCIPIQPNMRPDSIVIDDMEPDDA